MTEEQKKRIEELYPDYSGREIAAMLGISRTNITTYAKEHGFKHSEETVKRLRNKTLKALLDSRTEEVYAKAKEKMRRIRKMELLRLLSGQRQKTNLKFTLIPQRTAQKMRVLCCMYGYIRSNNINSTTLYYDGDTVRKERVERLATKKYGITFQSVD